MTKIMEGNARSALLVLGGNRDTEFARVEHDYYATDPKALELLLPLETFSHNVWECACGEGHLSKVLVEHGYDVLSTDLIDRGYGTGGIDFLQQTEPYDGDIVTNPPYKYALEFVEHAVDIVTEGHKVCMLLKIQFLEGKTRRKFFEVCPPHKVYVSSGRLQCCRNGEFEKFAGGIGTAVCYCWFIWTKGYKGETIVRWFN